MTSTTVSYIYVLDLGKNMYKVGYTKHLMYKLVTSTIYIEKATVLMSAFIHDVICHRLAAKFVGDKIQSIFVAQTLEDRAQIIKTIRDVIQQVDYDHDLEDIHKDGYYTCPTCLKKQTTLESLTTHKEQCVINTSECEHCKDIFACASLRDAHSEICPKNADYCMKILMEESAPCNFRRNVNPYGQEEKSLVSIDIMTECLASLKRGEGVVNYIKALHWGNAKNKNIIVHPCKPVFSVCVSNNPAKWVEHNRKLFMRTIILDAIRDLSLYAQAHLQVLDDDNDCLEFYAKSCSILKSQISAGPIYADTMKGLTAYFDVLDIMRCVQQSDPQI